MAKRLLSRKQKLTGEIVVVKNESDRNIGLSNAFLRPGMTTKIDKGLLSPGDFRVAKKGLLSVKDADGNLMVEPAAPKPEEPPKDVVDDKPADQPDVVDEPVADEPVADEPVDDSSDATDDSDSSTADDDAGGGDKVYTAEELEGLTKDELVALAEARGLDKKGRKSSLVKRILESQD